jgi:hypothetical protein
MLTYKQFIKEQKDNDYVYHGTNSKYLESIKKHGLKGKEDEEDPRLRHLHFTSSQKDATTYGDKVLRIHKTNLPKDTHKFGEITLSHGATLYRTKNKVHSDHIEYYDKESKQWKKLNESLNEQTECDKQHIKLYVKKNGKLIYSYMRKKRNKMMNENTEKRFKDTHMYQDRIGQPNEKHLEKLGNHKVIGEYSEKWPGGHKNVSHWVHLDSEHAVAWNEHPSRGWSYPIIKHKKQ